MPAAQQQTNHYIFTVKGPQYAELSAREVLQARLSEGSWPINHATPHQSDLKQGDMVLFYVAGKREELGMHFVAHAELSSPVVERSRRQARSRDWLGALANTGVAVHLEWSEWLRHPVSAKDLLEKLSFVKNEKYWGVHLMGGVNRIPPSDYELIVSRSQTANSTSRES